MNDHENFPPELTKLIDRALNGVITEDELRLLDAALVDNPAGQEFFLDYCQLQIDLTIDTRASAVLQEFCDRKDRLLPIAPVSLDAAESSSPLSSEGRSGFWPWATSGILFALLIVATGGWLMSYRDYDRLAAELNAAAGDGFRATPAAYLMVANGCDWSGNLTAPRAVGSSVQLGDEIELNEGIAEFRLASGVYLSLEGPASLVLASPSTTVLRYGKLTAHVPWTVTDFSAIASSCRVNACDAEFGIHLEGDKIETHVFSGEICARSLRHPPDASASPLDAAALSAAKPPRSARAFETAMLGTGQSLLLVEESDGLKVAGPPGKAAPDRFATKLPMAGSLPITKAYVDAVLESKPLGYWRFNIESNEMAADEAGGAGPLHVGGIPRFAGRAENPALEFQPQTNNYLLSEPLAELGPDAYSVELWIKPSHVHWGGVVALVTEKPAEDQAFYIELLGPRTRKGGSPFSRKHPGAVHILHRERPEGHRKTGTSCFSKDIYRLRRWQHIVAAKDESALRLYVDGELAGSADDATKLAPNLRLVIGGVGTYPFSRRLVGQLDEIALYDRALSAEEVKKHYESVKWRPQSHYSEAAANGVY